MFLEGRLVTLIHPGRSFELQFLGQTSSMQLKCSWVYCLMGSNSFFSLRLKVRLFKEWDSTR